MMEFRGVEERVTRSHTHSSHPGEQNRALIVPEEANLTLVSEVMSSSAKQQHFFITILQSLCACLSLLFLFCLTCSPSISSPASLFLVLLLLQMQQLSHWTTSGKIITFCHRHWGLLFWIEMQWYKCELAVYQEFLLIMYHLVQVKPKCSEHSFLPQGAALYKRKRKNGLTWQDNYTLTQLFPGL